MPEVPLHVRSVITQKENSGLVEMPSLFSVYSEPPTLNSGQGITVVEKSLYFGNTMFPRMNLCHISLTFAWLGRQFHTSALDQWHTNGDDPVWVRDCEKSLTGCESGRNHEVLCPSRCANPMMCDDKSDNILMVLVQPSWCFFISVLWTSIQAGVMLKLLH